MRRSTLGPVLDINQGGHRAKILARRDKLVGEHLGLARAIALKISMRLPASFDPDDLIATANLALIRAATSYRPKAHGDTPFSAYARQRIAGAVLDSARRRHYVNATMESLDISLAGRWSPAAVSPELETKPVVEAEIDESRLLRRVGEAISWLNPTQQAVILRYYGEGAPSLTQLGRELGVSRSRARSIHCEAIEQLQRRLRAVPPAA